MKGHVIKLLVLSALGTSLLSGCYSPRRVVVTPTGQVVVPEAPPPPKHEVIATAPVGQAWVPGYWSYQANRWVWIPGHYQVVPRSGAVWQPGHWDRTSRGWMWNPGHWE